MGKMPAAVVREGLKAYADRGIFQNFSETNGRYGKTRFEFLLFDDQPVTVELVERDHTLVIRNMLRQVPTDMYADLQDFLAALFDRDLPRHRRLDRRSADAYFVKRRGHVSLVVKVKGDRYKYAVGKLVSVIGWVRTYLQQWHPATCGKWSANPKVSEEPVAKAPLHSTGDASRLAALLVAHISRICSLLAPCQPGASPVSVRRGVSPRTPRRYAMKTRVAIVGIAVTCAALAVPALVTAQGSSLGETGGAVHPPHGSAGRSPARPRRAGVT